jgi:hypothetical protein
MFPLMKRARKCYFLATFWCFAIVLSAIASADPIGGMTYTYDLSQPDGDPGSGGTGILTTPHGDPRANDTVDNSDLTAVTSAGDLTDGNLGSLATVGFGSQMVVFANGTYAGFQNGGFGGAHQPKIDVTLGGTYLVDTLTLYYLVEDSTSIYAPQPVPDGSGGNLFDALSVSGSSDGVNFTTLGFTNDFIPVFGLGGDFGSGLTEVRSATISLGGSLATHLSVDVHTPYTFIFLSEIVVDGTAAASENADFDNDGDVDGRDFLIWQRGFGVGTTPGEGDANASGSVDGIDLGIWQSQYDGSSLQASLATVPEPSSIVLLAGWFSSIWVLCTRRIGREKGK